MPFERLRTEVELLIRRLDRDPEQAEAICEQLREKLASMRNLGLPLSAAMQQAERRLTEEERNGAEFENMPL